MPSTDRYGLPVTTSSSTAFDRFQEGVDDLLAYGPGAEERFAAALAADERLALAHVGRALLAAVQGDAATARAATARARETVDGATRRERQHVEAVSAFIAGETARGLALVDEHVAEFPRDAMLVNQASSAIALAGRSDREAHRVAFLERLAPAYGDDWWFQSALAFTYHEVDRFEESRRLSRASLDQYPRQRERRPQPGSHRLRDARHRGGVRVPGRLDDRLRPARPLPLPPRLAPGDVRPARGPLRAGARALRAGHPAREQPALHHDRRHRAALARAPRRGEPGGAAVAGPRRHRGARLAARLPLRRVPRRAGLRRLRRRGGADQDDGRPAGARRQGQPDRGPGRAAAGAGDGRVRGG